MFQQLPSLPGELLNALEQLARVLNDCNTDYALIGGLGVAVRGPVRATRDVDMLVNVPQIELPGVLEALAGRGFRVDLCEAIRTWNEHHLLDLTFGSVRVDWIKAVLPVFSRILSRARWEDLLGLKIRVADAEGLLLLKLISFRASDQEDIRGILVANRGSLELDWVREQWADLSTADDPRNVAFDDLVREFYQAGRQ